MIPKDKEFPGDLFSFGMNSIVVFYSFRWETVLTRAPSPTSSWWPLKKGNSKKSAKKAGADG